MGRFFANGFMKKVPATGGAVQTICKASGGSASWGSHGVILFAEWGPHASEAIQSVPEDGGATGLVTDEHLWHFWPEFLPDGEHFLYRLINGSAPESGLYIASLDRSPPRRLLSATSRAEVTRDGWLYFVRDGALVKQQVDVKTAPLLGQPVVLAQPVFTFLPTANANFSVDDRGGVVAYQRTAADAQLVWRDADGHELGRLSPVPRVRSFSISPDGRRVAIERFESASGVSDIWLYDTGRDVLTRVTANPYGCFTPIWTRDGHELAVTDVSPDDTSEPPQLARLSLSGATPRHLLPKEDGVQFPTDVLNDSSAVLYTVNRGSQKDIELISFADLKREPIESGPFNESDGVISPNGRSIAFTSDESGRPEIYIAPFRSGGEKTLVSADGGTEPHWSPDGNKLYYFRSGMLMSASVSAAGVDRPVPMFPLSSSGLELEEFRLSHYDVAPDGKRFLVREVAPGGDADPLTLIVTNPDH
jgi:Tol biopolymer transport system component